MKRIALAALSATLLQGCAAIIDGSHQEITVNTTPPAAQCALNREGENVGSVVSTPGIASVKKTKKDITVLCHKKGYADASYVTKSELDDWMWGNLLNVPFTGIIGPAIDWGTGAWNEYDSVVNLTLPPAQVPMAAEETKPEPVAVPALLGNIAPAPAAILMPAPEATQPSAAFGTLESPRPMAWPTTVQPTQPAITPAPVALSAPTPAPASALAEPARSVGGTPFGAPSAPLEAPRKAAPASKPRSPEAAPAPVVMTAPATQSSSGGWGDLGTEPAGRQK